MNNNVSRTIQVDFCCLVERALGLRAVFGRYEDEALSADGRAVGQEVEGKNGDEQQLDDEVNALGG